MVRCECDVILKFIVCKQELVITRKREECKKLVEEAKKEAQDVSGNGFTE
jgi:hypothetical protein